VNVSAADFVRAWMSSATLDQVAQKTGMHTATASTRATRLRRKGVKMPMLHRGGGHGRLNVAELNALIEKAGEP